METLFDNDGADDSIELLTQAFHARRRGDHGGAIGLFLRVFEQDRTNLFALIEVARVEAMRLEFHEVRRYLAQAEELAADDPEAWLEIAGCWLEALLPEECVRACREAFARGCGHGRIMARHLEALERMNRVEEGLDLLEGSGEIPPECRVIGARLLRRSGAVDRALALLSGDTTAKGLMERARVQDLLGRTRNAVESLIRAKEIIAANPECEYERALMPRRLEHLNRVRQAVTPGEVARWAGEDLGGKRPLVFLLGHPRSGTTLLETLLEKTGNVSIASEYAVLEQEMMNFVVRHGDVAEGGSNLALPLLTAPPDEIREIRGNYWRKIVSLTDAKEGQWVVDKNPGLTDGAHWIARCWPEAKILVMLRDPRDVIVSCVYQDFGLSRLGVACLTWEGAARAWAETMNHWVAMRGILPDDRWREVRYEELVGRADLMLGEITGLLGLSQHPAAEASAVTRLIRTPSYADVAAPVYQRAVGRWKAYDRWLRPLRPIIEPTMELLGYHWE